MSTSQTIQWIIFVVLSGAIIWQLSPLRDPSAHWPTFGLGMAFLFAVLGLRLLLIRNAARKAFERMPTAVSLVPEPSTAWKNVGERDRAFEELKAMHFAPVGDFRIPEFGALVAGFVRQEDQLAAAVYELPAAGVWVDIFLEYQNGDSLTVSNAPYAGWSDPMPGERKIIQKALRIPQLVERIGLERGAGRARTIGPSAFAQVIRESHRRKYEWQRNRGGITFGEALRMRRRR